MSDVTQPPAHRNGHGSSELLQPAHHSFGWKVWQVLKTAQARLRFIAILAAIGVVISYWDTMIAHYERWTRPKAAAQQDASLDAEYFCPMHPQIVRDKPGEKCPICYMPLSRRQKGAEQAEPLPAGVASRVQLSPYRIVLAGVETTEATYQPLTKEIATVGSVEFDESRLARIAVHVGGRSRIEKLHVNVTGQEVRKGDPLAELYSPELATTFQNLFDARRSANSELEAMARNRLRLWGIDRDQIDNALKTGQPATSLTIRAPIGGHVIRKYQTEGEYVDEGTRLYDLADLSSVWIQAQVYEEDLAFLREGLAVSATTPALPAREPFRGTIAFVYPHLDQNTRSLTVRFDIENPHHELRPGMYASVKIEIPASELKLFKRSTSSPGKEPVETGGKFPEREAQLRQGRVLAVPDSSVIDTGSRKVVYRESAPGVFDGVEVRLGPAMVGPDDVPYYPVLRGLKAGERVVTSGSFLIDAETRLNPAAGSIYYGGSGHGGHPAAAAVRPSTREDKDAEIRGFLAKLSPADRRLAESQRFCPIQPDNRLGSMGVPIKLTSHGETFFLCCKGCKEKAESDLESTLAKAKELRAKTKSLPR